MTTDYTPEQKQLQEANGTRALAERLRITSSDVLVDDNRTFVEMSDMFFLSTVDSEGRPTVSHKAGDPGFVKVTDENTLLFPDYDGNGMFLSLGNITSNPEIGMLFMSFERPHRVRVQGRARLSYDAADLALYKEVKVVVRVHISKVFMNCPRYIHRYEGVSRSKYVPRENTETPFAEWKRIDGIASELPRQDAKRAQELGLIDAETWIQKIRSGDPDV